MSGVTVVVAGLVLCFFGMASVHVAVPACGFALGWILADAFAATAATGLLIGVGGAVMAWIVVSVVLRAAGFVVGALAGGVIGAKVYTLLQGEDSSVILAVVFVAAVAAIGGFIAGRSRRRVLIWLCAIGGAGLVLNGLAHVITRLDPWVHDPRTSVEAIVNGALWIALAIVGAAFQHRRFASSEHARDDTN